MSGIKLIEKALQKTGFEFAHFAWNSEPKGDWGVYFETGSIAFNADSDEIAESCITGKVVYFTKDNSGRARAKIERALRDIDDIALSLPTITFDTQVGMICYDWTWTLI